MLPIYPEPVPRDRKRLIIQHRQHGVSGVPLQARLDLETGDLSQLPMTVSCIHPRSRHHVTDAPSFSSFVSSNGTPLSPDHYLLTLLHFNLVRAMTQTVLRLGINPDYMAEDIPSPFVSFDARSRLNPRLDLHSEKYPSSLPPLFHPTQLQRTVPHHPEYDILPCPRFRDNVISLQDKFDDVELCLDMIYGVDLDLTRDAILRNSKATGVDECRFAEGLMGGRTGLIVWSDPSLTSSWEVEEAFARKWKRLFVGCDDLLSSTNYWRQKRGERKLILKFE